jgi:hypothetical protein
MDNLNPVIDTYADIKLRIQELESEATRLRAMIINANPTNGVTYETDNYTASVSWCLSPDAIDRKRLFSVVSKPHLIGQGIVTPGSGYFRLSFRRIA